MPKSYSVEKNSRGVVDFVEWKEGTVTMTREDSGHLTFSDGRLTVEVVSGWYGELITRLTHHQENIVEG